MRKHMHIAIINGPNLNLLGRREPSIYGTRSMEQVLVDIQRMYPEVYFKYHQSNHEGVLIDWIQEIGLLAMANEPCDGIILNAGGYTHTSVALRDAVACTQVPVVEVHISDIAQRETFRYKINQRLSKFSQLARMEQVFAPFEKTATHKIKR